MFNCEVGRLSDRLYRDLAVPFKIRLEITFLQIRVGQVGAYDRGRGCPR